MKRVYANLLGKWTDITDGGTVHRVPAAQYIQEELDKLFEYNYVNVSFGEKEYRIHPSDIQIVTE